MKIAIALFGRRVSPRFDCAPEFEVVDITDGEISAKTQIDTANMTLAEMINELKEMGLEVLICGGIDKDSAQQLEGNGIKVYLWITGHANDALSCFLKGHLESGYMVAPGGHCCGRWRFCLERQPYKPVANIV